MKVSKIAIQNFRRMIWGYYRAYKRDLKWRHTHDPYAIVVSEIMLQQTQVDRVRGKYSEFLKQFPDFRSLAQAKPKEVLGVWQGLGYNRRALSLLKLAQEVVEEYGGKLPRDPQELQKFPGIGIATAGSIAAFAFNVPAIFVETNIRRVLIHHFFPRRRNVAEEEIQRVAALTLDAQNPREWYWALMDYGSMLGRTLPNPNRRSAQYRKQSTFRGSARELRGHVLRVLTEKSRIKTDMLPEITGSSKERLEIILQALEREGFLKLIKGMVMIA